MATKTTTTNTIDSTLASFKTTSAKIRYLASLNWPRGQIAKKLGIKYQWVRNVLITEVKTPKE